MINHCELATAYGPIFDLDRALIDSAPDLQEAVNFVPRLPGFRASTIDEVRSFIGNGLYKFRDRALAVTCGSLVDLDEFFDDFQKYYAARLAKKTRVMSAILETLIVAKDAGFKLVVCLNKAENIAKIILDKLAITSFFDSIVGSIEGRSLKPDTEPLHLCVEQMGDETKNFVLIGDSAADVRAARCAGMSCMLIRGGYTDVVPDLLEPDGVTDTANCLFGYLNRLQVA